MSEILRTEVNLIEYSHTFPEIESENEIPMDSKIREIQRKFNNQNRVILLHGSSGSGKTTLLAQFARQFMDCSFSYFLSNNYWRWSLSDFLLSLSIQMSICLGKDVSLDDEKFLDTGRAKTYFQSLSTQIIELVLSHRD